MWGQSAGKRESLDAVQALFTKSQSTGLLSTVLATNPKHRTIWAAMREVNSVPARPSTEVMATRLHSLATPSFLFSDTFVLQLSSQKLGRRFKSLSFYISNAHKMSN